MRKAEFKAANFRPAQISDSRFGIRKIYLNDNEAPSIFSYANPGRSWHGYR
jgi:hypothetical protein